MVMLIMIIVTIMAMGGDDDNVILAVAEEKLVNVDGDYHNCKECDANEVDLSL